MRVLITAWYDSPNTYIKDIADYLMPDCEVLCSRDVFWHTNISFDIVHIEWPEQLFFGKTISEDDIERLRKRIAEWKKRGAKIISTLHNYLPHQKKGFDEAVYDIVYNNADAIVNLGKQSTTMYPERYNVVIPHPNYNRHIIKDDLEEKPTDVLRFLCFGNIRSVEEEDQVINGFLKAKLKGAELIILNSLVAFNPYGWRRHPLKKIRYKLHLRNMVRNNIKLLSGKVSSCDINKYFNWADCVISPRIHNLNSGVVFMGFSFGKVVIGPAIGNIKEVLEMNGNPTYVPLDIESISHAIKSAGEKKHIGLVNKRYSDEMLDPKKIARQHFDLYTDVLERTEHSV